ncbi:MAG: GH92 family glycosyl hydrolase [Acidobacteria bacterium]|nr:GH92 family glycosyl hydrolase [Acidobacteriota bacterium]
MISRRDMLKGAAASGLWLTAGRRASLFEQSGQPTGERLAPYVDPFIGTGGHGHTFPGASLPSGMVQLSPDSGKQGWDWCAGYHYTDTAIAGFSHTHLSGTGIGDLCDILVTPTLAGADMPADVTSPFSHDREKASAGYYSVDLQAFDIKAEMTATRRVGVHRYAFRRPAAGRQPALVFDLGFAINSDAPVDTQITMEGPTTISGFRISKGWAADQRVYFVARFSSAVQSWLLGSEGEYTAERRQVQAKKARGLFRFTLRPGEPLLVKVAISSVSVEGARKNLDREMSGWEFDAVRRDAEEAWERKLQRVRIETPDKARKTVFYTAMYHALLAPTVFCDVDRAYRGADGKVQTSALFQNHTVFSLWDTFRALHPLLTVIQAERVDDLVQSMMAFYREGGLLPVWSLWGNETNTMVGYHAVPVIVDAVMKGLTTASRGDVLDAVKKSALQDARGLKWLKPPETRGYIPADQEVESVSKTLEYAFDDWCISQLAGKLERTADRRFFEARAGTYKNLFDPSTGFMRGRMSDGSWKTPFSPKFSQHRQDEYTEGNGWQYTWSVMHDVRGLMGLVGGPDAFVKKIDELFDQPSVVEGTNASPDISGLIGQYAHGNEPSHHIAYLYGYAGAPWKAASRVNQILTSLYSTGPEGLCGNEDCGQMSAWYLFSAMGFYPVNPAEGVYVIGTPHLDKVSIDIGGQRTFDIDAAGLSPVNRHITAATLNGKPLDRCWITHADIAAGGSLKFTMGAEPNRAWASGPDAAPPSQTPR